MDLQIKSVKPVGERVLIKVGENPNQTKSGIFIPDSVTKKGDVDTGDVISVLEGEHGLTVGDKVMYKKYNITNVIVEGIPHVVIPIHDVVCKLF